MQLQNVAAMSKILFKLRDVPNDEVQEVRELLDNNDIEYYETFGGNWGISLPALWLKKADQHIRAQELLDEYQQNRKTRAQQEYEVSRSTEDSSTLRARFIENPLRFIACLGLIGLVLFLSLRFFLTF